MGASTCALWFYGASSDEVGLWRALEDEHGQQAHAAGLCFGILRDGETTGLYLAVEESLVEVYPGQARVIPAMKMVAPQAWKERVQTFAASVGLRLQHGEPNWYLACETDRDY